MTFFFLKVYFKNMKRAKGGRGENKLFSLKEAVLGKTGDGI